MRFPFLQNPITSTEEAFAFIENLERHDIAFHFDDDPFDIIGMDGQRTFTDSEAKLIDQRVPELFQPQFNWREFECPFGFAIHCTEEGVK
jgi:hypothetical protein